MTADQMDDIMIAISKFFKAQGADDVVVQFKYGKAIDGICRVSICQVAVCRSYSIGEIASFANMNWLSNLLHTQEINLYSFSTVIDFVCFNINPFDE